MGTLLLIPFVAVVLLLLLPLLSELWSLLTPSRRGPAEVPPAAWPRMLFLVPAHNEERLIAGCVRSLLEQDYPPDLRRVVVIADNSTDRTAELARTGGAECMERTDAAMPGKPRALAWALESLLTGAWEACVVVDADTTVAKGFAKALASHAPLERKAVQGYIGTLNEGESWLTRLGGVLARCRYEGSYRLKARAGLNCPLTGNGMCIGRTLLEPQGWDAFSLTENWELYARYTAKGIPIDLAGDALLFSEEASSMRQGGTQRRRWLAGRIGVLRSYGSDILRSTSIGVHQKLDAVTELGGLSPVLHLAAAGIVGLLALLILTDPFRWWIAGAAALSIGPLVVQVIGVLIRHPEPGATIVAFLMLPIYAVWRVLVLVRTLLGRKDKTWRRTARN